jgi:acyl-CoA thioesterase YciA
MQNVFSWLWWWRQYKCRLADLNFALNVLCKSSTNISSNEHNDHEQHAQLPNDDRQLVMRVMPMPADANNNGDIFGGWILAQVDLAGAVLPVRISRGRVATIVVNEVVFKQPVSVGDLLSFYARVERIGTTSVTVHVDVYAERNPANLHIVKVTEANLTYVAIDREGRPRNIPKD